MKIYRIVRFNYYNKEAYDFIDNTLYLNKEDAQKHKEYLEWEEERKHGKHAMKDLRIIEFDANIF